MNLDFETYSAAGYNFDLATSRFKTANTDSVGAKRGLQLVGAYAYAEHHSAEVLTVSYSFNDGKTVHRWKPQDKTPWSLFQHVRDRGIVTAWH